MSVSFPIINKHSSSHFCLDFPPPSLCLSDLFPLWSMILYRDMVYSGQTYACTLACSLLSCVCPAVSHRKISRDTWCWCHLASAKPRGEVSHGTKGKGDIRADLVTQHQHCVYQRRTKCADLTTHHNRKMNRMPICSISKTLYNYAMQIWDDCGIIIIFRDAILTLLSGRTIVCNITNPH